SPWRHQTTSTSIKDRERRVKPSLPVVTNILSFPAGPVMTRAPWPQAASLVSPGDNRAHKRGRLWPRAGPYLIIVFQASQRTGQFLAIAAGDAYSAVVVCTCG